MNIKWNWMLCDAQTLHIVCSYIILTLLNVWFYQFWKPESDVAAILVPLPLTAVIYFPPPTYINSLSRLTPLGVSATPRGLRGLPAGSPLSLAGACTYKDRLGWSGGQMDDRETQEPGAIPALFDAPRTASRGLCGKLGVPKKTRKCRTFSGNTWNWEKRGREREKAWKSSVYDCQRSKTFLSATWSIHGEARVLFLRSVKVTLMTIGRALTKCVGTLGSIFPEFGCGIFLDKNKHEKGSTCPIGIKLFNDSRN